MNTNSLKIGDLQVELVRKQIKNLHVGVYPPDGRVRVAAPPTVSDDAVRVAVVSRLGWIKRQIRGFAEQARQSERSFASGETHYHLGHQYRLKVIERVGPAKVELRAPDWIELAVPKGKDRDFRERVFQGWQRSELRSRTAPIVDHWSEVLNVERPEFGIRRMKTKWGSCKTSQRRIWVNLELIKKPAECLRYIVLHEIAHLLEPDHGPDFIELLDRHMSNWRGLRDTLNSQPLRDERWLSHQEVSTR